MTDSGDRHKRGMAMAGLVVAVFFWAVNAVLAKGVITQIPPMGLSFYRWVVALICLFPFAFKGVAAQRQAIRAHIGVLFLLALPSVAIYNSFLYLSALYTTATNIGLVAAAMPAVTLGAAWLINKDRPGPVQLAGICLALTGVVIIVAKGSAATLFSLDINPGDLLMLAAIASWAVYSIYYKKLALPILPITFLFMTMVLGTLSIVPFYLWELIRVGGFGVNTPVILIFVYLGICPSVLSYIFWNKGVRILGAPTASVFVYLIPVFASVLAWVTLGERLFYFHFLGGILILTGLIFTSRESR